MSDRLISQRAIDYTRLRHLLSQRQWQAADEETTDVMLKAANRHEEGWLRVEDIERFPIQDLQTIDQLWVKYSKGRFGFSVQQRLWESIGGHSQAGYVTYEKFAAKVGWCDRFGWCDDPEFSFTAPVGHLPASFLRARDAAEVGYMWLLRAGWGVRVALYSRTFAVQEAELEMCEV
jgi:hypothetical protein